MVSSSCCPYLKSLKWILGEEEGLAEEFLEVIRTLLLSRSSVLCSHTHKTMAFDPTAPVGTPEHCSTKYPALDVRPFSVFPSVVCLLPILIVFYLVLPRTTVQTTQARQDEMTHLRLTICIGSRDRQILLTPKFIKPLFFPRLCLSALSQIRSHCYSQLRTEQASFLPTKEDCSTE